MPIRFSLRLLPGLTYFCTDTMNLRAYFSTFQRDMLAGIVVFLVALPLCLGIANASGVEPFAGLVSGIVGGLVVAVLSGSPPGGGGPPGGPRGGLRGRDG